MLTVTDTEGLTDTSTFTVTVAPNTAPTITPIDSVIIDQDSSTPEMTFVVDDFETPVGELIISATSSNPSLASASGINLTGSGPNRGIIVTPVAGEFGSATITVTVDDGNLTTTESFELTVNELLTNTSRVWTSPPAGTRALFKTAS